MNNPQITTLTGLQDYVAVSCNASASADDPTREACDALTTHAVRYFAHYKPRTNREYRRARRRAIRRARTQLIGGGILEAIILSALASLLVKAFEAFWSWWTSEPGNAEAAVKAMAVSLPGWTGDDDNPPGLGPLDSDDLGDDEDEGGDE